MWKKKTIKLIKTKDKDLFLLMKEQSEAEMQDWGEQKKPDNRLQNEWE